MYRTRTNAAVPGAAVVLRRRELGFAYSMLYDLTTNESYAYNAQTGAQCLLNKGDRKPVAGVTGYSKLAANDYDALMTAVATMGPMSISVDASWGACKRAWSVLQLQ